MLKFYQQGENNKTNSRLGRQVVSYALTVRKLNGCAKMQVKIGENSRKENSVYS